MCCVLDMHACSAAARGAAISRSTAVHLLAFISRTLNTIVNLECIEEFASCNVSLFLVIAWPREVAELGILGGCLAYWDGVVSLEHRFCPCKVWA